MDERQKRLENTVTKIHMCVWARPEVQKGYKVFPRAATYTGTYDSFYSVLLAQRTEITEFNKIYQP